MKNSFMLKMILEEKTLKIARVFTVSVAEYAGMKYDEVVMMELAINEVCENILKHGYLNIKGEVTLKIAADDSQLALTILDKGSAHDISKYDPLEMQTLVQEKIKGKLGIRFIKKACDVIRYKHLKGINRTTLVKKFSANSGATA